jgi:hypothetical protein
MGHHGVITHSTVSLTPAIKTYGKRGCTAPFILNHETKWKLVVSLTHWPPCPRGTKTRYLLTKRLGGLRSRSERFGEENKPPRAGIQTPVRPAFRRVTRQTTLTRLLIITHKTTTQIFKLHLEYKGSVLP